MPRRNHADTIEFWRRLLASTDEDPKEHPELKPARTKLAKVYKRVVELRTEQARLTAAKQAATREMQTLLEEGSKTANVVRVGMRLRHGNRSPKLIEHGIQPFRGGRPRKKKTDSGG